MRLTFIGALLAALLSAMPSARAAPVRANCALNHAAVSVSTESVLTTSANFVDVAESNIRFVQGGSKPGCIVISLSAEAIAGQNTAMAVRAVLDTTAVCESVYDSFVLSDATRSVRAANFLCTDVTPGAHRIKLQFLSSGGTVVLDNRTITVRFFR